MNVVLQLSVLTVIFMQSMGAFSQEQKSEEVRKTSAPSGQPSEELNKTQKDRASMDDQPTSSKNITEPQSVTPATTTTNLESGRSKHFKEAETTQATPTQATTSAPVKEIPPVFEKARASDLINSVNSVVRETAQNQTETMKGLRSALDVRLPIVLNQCDIKISHEILRVAYGVVTDAPEASKTLRELSSDFSGREISDFKGVSRDCAAALKGLGVAVTKFYLGDKWGEK
jgi:hypothetical protein